MTFVLNVLVVDDSLMGQKKLIAMIEELGHRVVATAETGEMAISRYSYHLPDVVTMDITMPDMNGIDATRAILESFPDARIVMATSHAQKSMVLDALDAGAIGYIIKPIQRDKLKEAFERAVKLKA
jgi:two-component system chemotaxis response regulator CheY